MRIFNNVQNDAQALSSAASRVARDGLVAVAPQLAPGAIAPTAHFTVSVVPQLGLAADGIAQAVAANCEADYAQLTSWFGIKPPQHFNIILANLSAKSDGTGGAYHADCQATDLYCDVSLIPTEQAQRSRSLAVAEMVEVYEALQNLGWDCGASNGEGLSRVLADDRYPDVLSDYATAASWLDSFRTDYVNVNSPTDTNQVANGCAVLFLNWLRWEQKFSWQAICQAGASTLAQTHRLLTQQPALDSWALFSGAMAQRYPSGKQCGLDVDNPFRPRP